MLCYTKLFHERIHMNGNDSLPDSGLYFSERRIPSKCFSTTSWSYIEIKHNMLLKLLFQVGISFQGPWLTIARRFSYLLINKGSPLSSTFQSHEACWSFFEIFYLLIGLRPFASPGQWSMQFPKTFQQFLPLQAEQSCLPMYCMYFEV